MGTKGGGGRGISRHLTEYKEMGLKRVDCRLTVSKGGREGVIRISKSLRGDWVDPPSLGDRK